jgi:hypothetical protein
MSEEFGFTPEYTTREAAEAFATYVRVKRYRDHADDHLFDREMLDYVQRKMQQMPALSPELLAKWVPAADDGRSEFDDD